MHMHLIRVINDIIIIINDITIVWLASLICSSNKCCSKVSAPLVSPTTTSHLATLSDNGGEIATIRFPTKD